MTGELAHRRPADFPTWFPSWASQLADLYFSGTTAAFVLHGNTYDLFRIGEGDDADSRYGVLADFLAEQLFGRWSLVLHYDLGRGLRAYAGSEEKRLKEMVTLANKRLGDLSALPKDPAATFALLDRFVRNNIMAAEDDRLSLAVILDQASYVFPAGEPGRLSAQASSHLVTMLNWAMSPHVKRLNMAFVMVDEKLADLSDRLTGNPHVATIEVPLPAEAERAAFITDTTGSLPPEGGSQTITDFSDYNAAELAKLTAGISLTDLNVMVQSARETGRRLDAKAFRALKKRLLERQCHGLLEFIEPKWTLDTVVGHDAAKAASAGGCGAAEARRVRHPADGLPALRPGRHRQVVPRAVRERRDRRAVRDPEELPIEVCRRDGRQSRARALGAARDGAGGGRRGRSGRGAGQP